MTRNSFTTAARRTVTSTLAALVLTAALPQTGFAAPDTGLWRWKFSADSATLTIKRVGAAHPDAVLTVVTHIVSDGRVTTQETAQPGMEECLRLAEVVNKANGSGKYKFFASCREGQQYLVKVD